MNGSFDDLQNPYKSPGADGKEQPTASRFTDSDIWGLAIVLFIGASLTAIGVGFAQLLVLAVFIPFITFFVLIVWTHLALSRPSNSSAFARVAAGAVLGLFGSPAAVFALAFTCSPTLAKFDSNFDPIHGTNGISFPGLIITFLFFVGLGLLGFGVLYKMRSLGNKLDSIEKSAVERKKDSSSSEEM